MIPSRGPIQVRLEDTGGPRLQCKPPAQVKILRRPQPFSNDRSQTNSATTTTTTTGSNIDNNKVSHLDRFAESAFDDITTDEFSSNNSSSHKKTSEQQQNGIKISAPTTTTRQQLNYSTVAATNIRKVINSNSGIQNNQKIATVADRTKAVEPTVNSSITTTTTTTTTTSTSEPIATTTATALGFGGGGISGSNNNNKKPLKTYQERADEYAKARLRILGSAFPENEDITAPSDDVHRVLNF